MTQQTAFFPLGGGMDLVTPAVAMSPGRVVAALNYEPVAAGYRRIRGYERFDGHAAPSAVTGYHVLHFINGDADLNSIVAGTMMDTAGSPIWRALALAVPVITSGTTGAGTAAGYIGVTVAREAGAALPSGVLRIVPPGDSLGTTVFASYSSLIADEAVVEAAGGAWLQAAFDVRKAEIEAVPGSGPVRGIFFASGHVIAIRDNAGATAADLYYSSMRGDLGWQLPSIFAATLSFTSGGTYEVQPGDALTGETSGASRDVVSVTLTSGSWAGGDAEGTMLVIGGLLSGDFIAAETVDVVEEGTVTHHANSFTVGAEVEETYDLPAGGAYEIIAHNFYGASDLTRFYGVSGAGPAFTFDPDTTSLTPILTGMADDRPNHVAAHKGSLFLSFPGGSVQFSTVGDPTSFNAVVGAGEIGIGSDVTGFVETAGALAIFGENNVNILYGSDSTDYQLEMLSDEAGALPHTMQRIGQVVYMDNRGLRSLSATQAYGNFSMGTISRLIQPLLEDKRRDSIEPTCSLVCRTADQYWLFFEDGTGIIVNFSGKQPSILPFDFGLVVTCAVSGEDDGVERLFIGSDDGFVYELNKGTSFDGAAIEHYLRLPFNHFGQPRLNKRLHKVIIDLEAAGTTTLQVSADLNYGAEPGTSEQTLVVTTGGGAIDSLGSNELYFASQIETTAEAYLDGVARDVSLKIGGETDDEEPHTLTGVTFHVSPRGMQR